MEENENENEEVNEGENGDNMWEVGSSHDNQKDRSVAVAAPRLHKLQDLVCNNVTLQSSLPSWQACHSCPCPFHKRCTVPLCLELQNCVHNAE